MKPNYSYSARIGLFSVIIPGMLFMIRPAVAQSDTASVSKSSVTMKIIHKTDGDSIVADTTLTFEGPYSDEEIREMTKSMKEQARALREQMRVLRDQMGVLRDFDIDIDLPEIPDFPDMIMMPEIPDIPSFDFDIDSISVPKTPGPPLRIIHNRPSGRGGLNEVLGDIPMDRVKSLSIREKKNGRKIVIEVDDTPSRRVKKEVIIVRPDDKHRKGRTYKIKPGASGMMTI